MLLDAGGEATKSLDQALLTLSAGALGISLTFIKDIAQHPIWELYLFLAWLAFAIALCATLISFRFSQYGFDRQVDILDAEQSSKEPLPHQECHNQWIGPIEVANTIAIVSFMAGVTSLAWFCIINFHK